MRISLPAVGAKFPHLFVLPLSGTASRPRNHSVTPNSLSFSKKRIVLSNHSYRSGSQTRASRRSQAQHHETISTQTSYTHDGSRLQSLNLNSLPESILCILFTKMDEKLCRRIIPVVAFKLTIAAFALALTTLLVGITGNNPKSAALLTVNSSYSQFLFD